MRVLYYSKLINSSAGAGVHGREFLKSSRDLGVHIDTYPEITQNQSREIVSKARILTKGFPPTITETTVYLRNLLLSYANAQTLRKICMRGKYDAILMRLQDIDWTCKIVAPKNENTISTGSKFTDRI